MLALARHLTHPLAAGCLGLLSIATPAAPQGSDRTIKLNEPLATDVSVGVVEAKISPDGQWVVYLATQDSGVPGLFSARIDGSGDGSGPSRRVASADTGAVTVWEVSARNEVVYTNWRRLYVAPLDGSRAPLPLTQLDEDGPIETFLVSGSGSHVVYVRANETTGRAGLFSVPTDGSSTPVRLFGPGVQPFTLDARGELVAFVAHASAVYVVPIEGGVQPRLVNAGGFVPHYRPLLFSPDGGRLLYCAGTGSNDEELWSAPTDGSQPAVKLNGPLDPTGYVDSYRISSDGKRVLYIAHEEYVGPRELFSVPIDASLPAVKLNGITRNVHSTYAFDAGHRRAVFLSDEQGAVGEPELYHAPTDGSAPARMLSPPILDPISGEPSFVIARGRRVVYRSLQDGVVDLYSVPLGRGETHRLTHTSASGPFDGPQDPKLTPDGRTIVYLDRVGSSLQLAAVPVDGSRDPVVLGGPLHAASSNPLQISSDSKHVVVHTRVDGVPELHGVPIDGHRPLTRLHRPLVQKTIGDDVDSFQVRADGSQALFTVRAHLGEPWSYTETQLYTVRLEPGAVPQLLYVTQPYENKITRYVQSANGQRVVFVERLGDSEPQYALRSVPADGSGPAVTLAGPGPSNVSFPFHVTPDGNRAVFTLYDYELTDGRILSVPTAGGPAIELADVSVEGGNILNSRLSPDGTRVVYAADALVDEVVELFSAPVDGSAPAVRLNAPLAVGGDVLTAFSYTEAAGYEISPDGSTVVYLADQEQNGRNELYRVPIDGSAAPVRVNGDLPSGADVEPRFRISDDGQWIVYVADQATNGKAELFAGPLDGSSPAVRISGPLVAGGNVEDDFELDPVRGRAVYRADQLTANVFELFSVALDGSEPAVRLNGPLGPDDDVVTDFVVAPDGAHVMFLAGAEERLELFSAALGIANSAVKLGGNLAADREVLAGMRFSSDGALALFAADLEIDERFELWAAPSDGGRPWRVNDRFVAGGDLVRPAFAPWEFLLPVFEAVPGQQTVLYLADQDDDEALELYLGRLDRPRTPARSIQRSDW